MGIAGSASAVREVMMRGWGRGIAIGGIVAVMAAVAFSPCRADDDALAVAPEIAALVAGFPNFRGRVAHGEWREVEPWSVRATDACHQDLRSQAVVFEAVRARQAPIPAPVRVIGEVGGVRFRKLREAAPVIVACELAARLPAIARVMRAHGIVEVRVMSAWRRAPRTSFHTMGLALDLASFVREDGSVLDVEGEYVIRERAPTCGGEDVEPGEHARALRALACDLADSGVLSTVITPAYSAGHRSHLHVDARPDDPRLFVR